MKLVNAMLPISRLREFRDTALLYESFDDHNPVLWFHFTKVQIVNSINVFEYIKHSIWNR